MERVGKNKTMDKMRYVTLFLVGFTLLGIKGFCQKQFILCPKYFFVINDDLQGALDTDFSVNGKEYPKIVSVSEQSIMVSNPFISDDDVFEVFNRLDSASVIVKPQHMSFKVMLSQLGLAYSKERSFIKEFNTVGQFRYCVYSDGDEYCKLIQFDSLTQLFRILAVFRNTLELSRVAGSIYFFEGSSSFVIANLMTRENVIVDRKSGSIYYKKTPSGLYTIGVGENGIWAVDEGTYQIYELSYLSHHQDSMRLKLPHYKEWAALRPFFFYDYVSQSLYVYRFNFQRFCVVGENYLLK